MNSTSSARSQAEVPRTMASAASVPSTTERAVVQAATTRLFHAARCIWSASSKAAYHRSDSPSGGNFSDCEAVNEVSSMTKVGATRNTIATAVSAPKTSGTERASQSIARLDPAMAVAPSPDEIEDGDRRQDGDEEDDRDGRRERPVIGADRLLVDVQRHVEEP